MIQTAFQKHLARPQIIVGVCHGCRQKHRIEVDPTRYSDCFSDWRAKHSGPNCCVEFRRLRKRIAEYAHNADIKVAYGGTATFALTLASLASDTNLLAGRESTAISNTSNKYLDGFVGGKVTTGTTPTAARRIEVWAAGSVNDTPLYPDTCAGTDANVTLTSSDIKYGALALLGVLGTDSTTNRTYWMRPTSLLQAFSGVMPTAFSIFVVQNTAVALNSTGGNHAWYFTPNYITSI